MPPPTIHAAQKQSHLQQAFTLIELSIVLVIIGLLVGVVVIGQSLVEAARIHQAVSLHTQFLAAWNSFKAVYNATPGDMSNATMFWGVDDSCPLLPGSPTTSGTCNGNGDGKVKWANNAIPDSLSEAALVFSHLKLSGLLQLPCNYCADGGNGSGDFSHYALPKFRIQYRSSWFVGSDTNYADYYPAGTVYEGSDMTGNALQTAINVKLVSNQPLGAVANPQMVMAIDTKLDDGLPRKGKFQASRAVPYHDTVGFDVANLLNCYISDGAGGYTYNGALTVDACRFLYSLD